MAFISNDELWRSVVYNNVSAKDRFQKSTFNQLKLKLNHIYKKTEKLTSNFEPDNYEDVVNKCYLGTEISKVKCHISFSQ